MGEPRTLAFGVLGTLQIRRGSTPVVVDSRTQRIVLARLIVQDGPVGEDALVDAVWRGRPPASAVSSLRSHVSRLRGTLSAGSSDPVVVHGHGGYRLVGPATVDAVAFEQFVVAASADRAAGDRQRARERLSAGLALWRGEALAEFRYEPFAQAAIARLEALRLQATEDQVEVAIDLGAAAEVVPELEALAVAHPLRERVHALLMLALYRCGRQADALAAYQRARRTHVDELGVDPPPLLQHLHRDILRQDERLLRPEVVGQVSLQPAPEASVSTTSWRELTAAVDLPPLSAEVRGELLVARGRALRRAGKVEDSRLAYAAALRLANDAGDAEGLAVAALGLAGPPEDTHAGEAHDEALLERALLGLPADSAVGAQLRARLAVALLDRGDARGHELLGSATDAARTHGDPAALSYALRSRHRSWFDPSQLPARRELADELLRIGVRSGDHQIEAWGHRWRAIDLIEAGEIDAALAALAALEELVETEPEAFHRWAVLVRRAGCRLLREPVQKSETAVLEALALTDEMRSELTTLAASMLLVTLRFMQGRIGELEAVIGERLVIGDGFRPMLPFVYAEMDRRDEAAAAFEDLAIGDFAAVLAADRIQVVRLLTLAMAAEVAAYLQDTPRAQLLYRLLSPFSGRVAVVPPGISATMTIDHCLGRLAATLGRSELAETHFQRSLAQCQRNGAVTLVPRTQLAYAQLLRTQLDRPDRADAVATDALDRSADLGLGHPQVLRPLAEGDR